MKLAGKKSRRSQYQAHLTQVEKHISVSERAVKDVCERLSNVSKQLDENIKRREETLKLISKAEGKIGDLMAQHSRTKRKLSTLYSAIVQLSTNGTQSNPSSQRGDDMLAYIWRIVMFNALSSSISVDNVLGHGKLIALHDGNNLNEGSASTTRDDTKVAEKDDAISIWVPLCPYDLLGECKEKGCQFQHIRKTNGSYTMSSSRRCAWSVKQTILADFDHSDKTDEISRVEQTDRYFEEENGSIDLRLSWQSGVVLLVSRTVDKSLKGRSTESTSFFRHMFSVLNKCGTTKRKNLCGKIAMYIKARLQADAAVRDNADIWVVYFTSVSYLDENSKPLESHFGLFSELFSSLLPHNAIQVGMKVLFPVSSPESLRSNWKLMSQLEGLCSAGRHEEAVDWLCSLVGVDLVFKPDIDSFSPGISLQTTETDSNRPLLLATLLLLLITGSFEGWKVLGSGCSSLCFSFIPVFHSTHSVRLAALFSRSPQLADKVFRILQSATLEICDLKLVRTRDVLDVVNLEGDSSEWFQGLNASRGGLEAQGRNSTSPVMQTAVWTLLQFAKAAAVSPSVRCLEALSSACCPLRCPGAFSDFNLVKFVVTPSSASAAFNSSSSSSSLASLATSSLPPSQVSPAWSWTLLLDSYLRLESRFEDLMATIPIDERNDSESAARVDGNEDGSRAQMRGSSSSSAAAAAAAVYTTIAMTEQSFWAEVQEDVMEAAGRPMAVTAAGASGASEQLSALGELSGPNFTKRLLTWIAFGREHGLFRASKYAEFLKLFRRMMHRFQDPAPVLRYLLAFELEALTDLRGTAASIPMQQQQQQGRLTTPKEGGTSTTAAAAATAAATAGSALLAMQIKASSLSSNLAERQQLLDLFFEIVEESLSLASPAVCDGFLFWPALARHAAPLHQHAVVIQMFVHFEAFGCLDLAILRSALHRSLSSFPAPAVLVRWIFDYHKKVDALDSFSIALDEHVRLCESMESFADFPSELLFDMAKSLLMTEHSASFQKLRQALSECSDMFSSLYSAALEEGLQWYEQGRSTDSAAFFKISAAAKERLHKVCMLKETSIDLLSVDPACLKKICACLADRLADTESTLASNAATVAVATASSSSSRASSAATVGHGGSNGSGGGAGVAVDLSGYFSSTGLVGIDSLALLSNTKVGNLALRHNHLKEFPLQVLFLSGLACLDLSWNLLTTLPACLPTSCPNLAIVKLSNNSFKTIPKAIARLLKLQELYFDHNFVEYIPAELASLKSLGCLDVSNNLIKSVPTGFNKLRYFRM